MFVLISYDIRNDRNRTKVMNILEDHGTRVQYSVFECLLDERRLLELKESLREHMDPEGDSIRFYFLCEACVGRVDVMGRGEVARDEGFVIV
ncbi:MAG: CRISPR-associated endonuclease Cas2 [bacterium]